MIFTIKKLLLLALIVLFSGCDDEIRQTQEEFRKEIDKRQSDNYEHFKISDVIIDNNYQKKEFYVPVYSHIFYSQDRFLRLAITLSIRNTDLQKDLYIQNIDYYNTEGILVKKYINETHILKPMASIDYVVNLDDMSGGSGANFIVDTASKDNISTPIIQAIMINNSANTNISFVTDGIIIK